MLTAAWCCRKSSARLQKGEDDHWQQQSHHHFYSLGSLWCEVVLKVGLQRIQLGQVFVQKMEVQGQEGGDVGEEYQGKNYFLYAEGGDTAVDAVSDEKNDQEDNNNCSRKVETDDGN